MVSWTDNDSGMKGQSGIVEARVFLMIWGGCFALLAGMVELGGCCEWGGGIASLRSQ